VLSNKLHVKDEVRIMAPVCNYDHSLLNDKVWKIICMSSLAIYSQYY